MNIKNQVTDFNDLKAFAIANFEDLKSGLQIGSPGRRFQLMRKLGNSSESRVWLARLVESDETAPVELRALKIFALRGSDNLKNLPAALHRIRARVEVAKGLDHPNIVHLYNWHQDNDGWPFLEMEYLDHRTGFHLGRLIKQHNRDGLSWAQTLQLLRAIAAALDYAHQQHRLAHRNLKVENVFVNNVGHVKLLDFGLTYRRRVSSDVTVVTRLLAPQHNDDSVQNSGEVIDIKARQDIGALAALAYEMLCGKAPFEEAAALGQDPFTWPVSLGDSHQHAKTKATFQPTDPALLKPARLNETVWQVLQQGLNYQDAQCFSSAGELVERLEAANKPAGDIGDTFSSQLTHSTQPPTDSLTTEEVTSTVSPNDLDFSLKSGLEIGPSKRRFRLLRKINDNEINQLWLVQLMQTGSDHDKELRALKIFTSWTQNNRKNLSASLKKIHTKAQIELILDHPSITKSYGWWQGKDGWPCFEMEYLDQRANHDLKQLLDQTGRVGLGWPHTLELLRPIAAALDYAHQQHHLVHGKLKAENVFISPQGEVKLLGFDLEQKLEASLKLRLITRGDDDNLHQESATEQGLKFRQNIGALAALAYEMLCGKLPVKITEAGEDTKNRMADFDQHDRDSAASQLTGKSLAKPTELTERAWKVLLQGLNYQDARCPDGAEKFVQLLETAQTHQGKKNKYKFSKKAIGFTLLFLLVDIGIGISIWTGQEINYSSNFNQASTKHIVEKQSSSIGQSPESTTNDKPLALTEAAKAKRSQADIVWGQIKEKEQFTLDKQAFAAAQRVNTPSAYQLYLLRCPACGYQQQAKDAIKNLQTQAKIIELKKRLQAYLKPENYTNHGYHHNDALVLLEQLQKLDPQKPFIAKMKRKLALMYSQFARQSVGQHDYENAHGWLQLAKQIAPQLAEEWAVVTAAIGKAEFDEAKAAYARAIHINTPKAYLDYLNDCANPCHFQLEAHYRLKVLQFSSSHVIRDQFTDDTLGPEMVVIPPGVFMIGSFPSEQGRDNDESQRQVAINRPFAIGKYEVTFEEYDHFAEATQRPKPDDNGWGRGQRPIINVSWDDALAYAQWLSQQTRQRYRLPTESEWEYAARGNTQTSRYWGNDPDEGCHYANGADLLGKEKFSGWNTMNCRDGYTYTAPVGQYKPNAFGIFDILGNALEWTCTDYDTHLTNLPQSCSKRNRANYFVIRGGSWSDEPSSIRSAERYRDDPNSSNYYLGFRVVRELELN